MWFISKIMGTTNSTYLEELSDDESSDNDFDYYLEPRPDRMMSIKNNSPQNIVPLTESKLIADEESSAHCVMNDVTTDAAVRNFPKPDLAITLDGLLQIEKNLENYEMVSLVYLLYQDALFALQQLSLYLRGAKNNPLHSWAVIEQSNSNPWQSKLIEALCIIKNYEILRTLGYKKNDLIYHYLPHLETSITNLNKMRKAFYLICEKMDCKKTDKFLDLIQHDFQQKNIEFEKYNPEYLELYFLSWESKKYITMTDVHNVKAALKVMDDEALYDILENVFVVSRKHDKKHTTETVKTPTKEQPSRTRSTDAHQRPSTSREDSEDFNSSPSIGRDNSLHVEKAHDRSHIYEIDPNNPGLALIINQEEFYTEFNSEFEHLLPEYIQENKLDSRVGTQKDKEDLVKTFNSFGYKTFVEENLTHYEVIAKVKEVVKSVKNESSLFVCILSHGDKGVVYGSNSCKVKVSEIQDIMCKANKDNLTGKPKILILQSCQGKSCQKVDESSEEECENTLVTTDGPKTNKSSTPRTVDLLTFWATVPGYAAIRHKRRGSWFIQALVKKMVDFENRIHFADICTRIISDVSDKMWIVQNEKNAMTPVKAVKYCIHVRMKDLYPRMPVRGQ